MDGEGGEIGRHGGEATRAGAPAAIPLLRLIMSQKRRTRADEPYLLMRTLGVRLAAGPGDRAARP